MQGITKRIIITVAAFVALASSLNAQQMAFTKNMGQWPDSILFRSSANGATMWFTKNGIWYQFSKRVEKPNSTTSSTTALIPHPMGQAFPTRFLGKFDHWQDSIEISMIKAEFIDASKLVEVIGNDEMEYKCNYFIGNDSTHWHTDVPNYTGVTMRGLYPGVDVTFSTKDGRLELEQIASSSDKLTQIKVEYIGELGGHQFDGILLVNQEVIKSKSRVSSATSKASAVSLVYSTYLGGNDYDVGYGIAVDTAGNAYVTGTTASTNFPTQNPFDNSYNGLDAAFITKLSSNGTGPIYSTYLGEGTIGFAIAVDINGNAYVTGYTLSIDFPLQNPFQPSFGGGGDIFVSKLNHAGNTLVYSTYFGGSFVESSNDIAIDVYGNTYITGFTASTDFPTVNPIQTFNGGGSLDAFAIKINSTGSTLIYSTYLGGSWNETGHGIAADHEGNTYITGKTSSHNFPILHAFDSSYSDNAYDAFVTKINSTGSTLIYSTYLSGSGGSNGTGIAVDTAGNAYVTGGAGDDFPTHNPFQTYGGIFVTKLNTTGSGLIYSTCFGGSYEDVSYGITVDLLGNAYITGYTASDDFPIQNAFQDSINLADVFVTKFNSSGNGLIYSTYIGGNDGEVGNRIVVDLLGNAYVTGFTTSSDFPIHNSIQDSIGNDSWDAFVVKLTSGPSSISCCTGIRGNVNKDANENITITDLSYLISFLFRSGPLPVCIDEANINADSGNNLTITDVAYLVNFLFRGGAQPPACP